MGDEYVATVRIRRPKVSTDDRGRTVWQDTIETAQLELVSTTRLQAILESDDKDSQGSIRKAISGSEEGVLARDPATGLFEVISDEDLQAILDTNDDLPAIRRPTEVPTMPAAREKESEELSLVSTQMLRKIILTDEKPTLKKAGPARKPSEPKDRTGGFDPYNSG